jgi:hypothetical protein
MYLVQRLTARFRPPTDSVEVARIRAYESTQRKVCEIAGAVFEPPDYHKLVALAPSVLNGHLPVRGSRQAGDTVEWSIFADDEPMPPLDELFLQHLHHLATLREDLVMYLALPVGWSFAVLADGLGTWASFSPSDQIRAEIGEFLSADRTARTAETIKGILDEAFGDVQSARDLSEDIDRYRRDSVEPAGFEAKLRAIYSVVRGAPGDRRLPVTSPDADGR